MKVKQFKYQLYLDKYENCPMEKCVERNVPAFRWVYSHITSEDFLPNVYSERFPKKTLDNSDLNCEDFALSMFDSFESAISRYFHFYKRNVRPSGKEIFIRQKGDSIALLNLKKEDGVSDESNDIGHFSFFEYINFDYLQRFKQQFSIFAHNDSNKDISNQ